MSTLHYQIRPYSILSFWKKSKDSGRSLRQKQAAENFVKSKTYTGLFTPGSRKRLSMAIDQLISIALWKPLLFDGKEYMFKVNFVTLTLYSFGKRIPGKEAHSTCLEPFLLWLRRRHGVKSYIWKAELQGKRKDCHQLHYHLTTDQYIDCHEMRDKWNELQEKAGYLDTWFERHPKTKVDKKTGEVVRNMPNSTDVHATYHIRNLSAYFQKRLLKYSNKRDNERMRINTRRRIGAEMGKEIQNWLSVDGKLWDCSQNLKAVGRLEIEGFQDVTASIARAVEKKYLFKNETIPHCTIFECMVGEGHSYLPFDKKIVFENYRNYVRNYDRTAEKIPKELQYHFFSHQFN